MPSRGWRALPECLGPCARPVNRRTAERNGGYCTDCRPITGEHPITAGARLQLAEWQETVARIRRAEAARSAEVAARRRQRRQQR